VAGVTIEVIDGIPAGLAVVTDGSGSFRLGNVTVTVGKTKIRASKDGYATSLIDAPNGSGHALIGLWSLTTPVVSPGEYTMSFVADTACDLPEVARTRTYSATFTLNQGVNLPPEHQTSFNVVLSGASFFSGDNDVWINVAGNYVAFFLDSDMLSNGLIAERLAPATHLELVGSVAGFVGTSGASSLPFEGSFTYCEKQSDMGPVGCLRDDPVFRSCHSKNHRVMLTRQ
jgi:hypothetical protein